MKEEFILYIVEYFIICNERTIMEKHSKKKFITYLFILTNIVLFCVWMICLVFNQNGIQRGVLFSDTNDWFMDFYNTIYYSVGREPYSWGDLSNRNYLPIVYLLLYPFTFLFRYDREVWGTTYEARNTQLLGVAGAIYLTVSFGLLFYTLYKAMEKKRELEKMAVLMSLFFNGLVLYCYDRGNLWVLTIALIFTFLLTYQSDSPVNRQIGIFCLALASTFKLFPAILGVVLLYKKQWKDAVIALLEGILLSVVPFLFLHGSLIDNIRCFATALKEHGAVYQYGSIGFASRTVFNFDNSKWTALGLITCAITLIVASKMKERDKITLLLMALVITSGQQGRYVLLVIFLPIIYLLNDAWKKTDIVYLIIYLLLLTPIQYYYSNQYITLCNTYVNNTLLLLLYMGLLIKGIYLYIQNLADKYNHLTES